MNNKLIKYLFVLLPFIASAQEDLYSKLRKQYSTENAVFVSRKEDAIIKIENNTPVIYSNVYEELLLLTDKASEYMDREVYWQDFSSIKDLDAHSINPDGGKFKTMKVKDFTRTNEITDGTFYDDERAYRFAYPGLTNGSREVLSYTEKITDPHLYGRFFFNSFAPVDDEQFSVTVPSDVKIRYKLYNITDSALNLTVKQSGKNTLYTWKFHNSRKIKPEEDAPAMSYYTPHIVVLLDNYTVNGKEKKVMSDPASLYDWYYGMVKDVNKEISLEVKKVTDSITEGATTNLEKVERIFYWVQNNITYVAYEDSLGGFIPREASIVCTRRFGDCKDMASTLVEMIRAAGLEAYKTWIGTRDIPYSFDDVPSPMSTNHMICTYVENEKKYYLDATGKDAPFGFYTSMIQGKEAFIGKGEDNFEIAKVPEMDTNKNGFVDSVYLKIDRTILLGEGILKARGYDKINEGRKLRNYENKDKQNLLMELLVRGNNKFRIDTASFENLDDREKDLGIRYKFSIPDYTQANGKDVFVNMQLAKKYMNDLIEPDRQAPREFENKYIDKEINVLEIPAGYKVSYMPGNSNYITPKFGFRVNYTQSGNKIIYSDYLFINTLMVNPADFAGWNTMIRKLTHAYNETITLTKE